VALSPYNKEHYFIAFSDRSIKYNFKGAPAEWMRLMTEVFDVWAAERSRMQYLTLSPPQHMYAHPGMHLQPQAYFPQQSAYLHSASPSLVTSPMSPPLTPGTPLPIYMSSVQQYAVSTTVYANKALQGGAIDMPVELPGDMISGAVSISEHSGIEPTKKKKRFFSKLF
jgi:hypothetical protein